MSVKTIRIDDLEENETPADETVQVGLDGKWVELDLCAKNATKLRNILAPYISAGQSVRPAVLARSRAGVSSSAELAASREQKQAIREWARSKGLKVSHKGRIPQDVQDAFDAEHARQGHPVKAVPEPAFSSAT